MNCNWILIVSNQEGYHSNFSQHHGYCCIFISGNLPLFLSLPSRTITLDCTSLAYDAVNRLTGKSFAGTNVAMRATGRGAAQGSTSVTVDASGNLLGNDSIDSPSHRPEILWEDRRIYSKLPEQHKLESGFF